MALTPEELVEARAQIASTGIPVETLRMMVANPQLRPQIESGLSAAGISIEDVEAVLEAGADA